MQELILSFPRRLEGFFRIRTPTDSEGVLVQSISGQSVMKHTDNVNGRMHVLADVEFSEYIGKTHAKLSITDTYTKLVAAYTIPDDAVLLEGYMRLCFRRQFYDWRLRVEPDGSVLFVDTYQGIIDHDWYDEGPHLFHRGKAWLFDGKAFLIPGPAIRPASVDMVVRDIYDLFPGNWVKPELALDLQ